jgi:GNAT superfamily N-acetyltransferase
MTAMLHVARLTDVAAIESIMRESLVHIGRQWYEPRQIESAVKHIAIADPQIIRDGTYYVIEEDAAVVACGGWSRREKLFAGSHDAGADDSRLLDPASEAARIRAMFVHPDHARRGLGRLILRTSEEEAAAAGFRRFELMALLPGVPLYATCHYRSLDEAQIELPDGVTLSAIRMAKDVDGGRLTVADDRGGAAWE